MKNVFYVKSDTCSRCHQLLIPASKKAEEINATFQEIPFESAEIDVSSVPMLYIKDEGTIETILDFDGIVERINSKEENSDDLPF